MPNYTDFLPLRKDCRCSCHAGHVQHIAACCIDVPAFARVTLRRHHKWPSDHVWGFDCPEGFAPFGEKAEDKEAAARCAEQYNNGSHTWSYWPIAETTLL